MLAPLPLLVLVPTANYGVMRDPAMHETIVVSGRTIREEAKTSRDFRHYSLETPIPSNYVRIDCGAFTIAVWRDPTRPELSAPHEPEPEAIHCRTGTPEVLAAEDLASDLTLFEELATDAAQKPHDDWDNFLSVSAQRFADSILDGYSIPLP